MSQPLKPLNEYTHHGCWLDRVGHATITTRRLRDTARYDGLYRGYVDVPTRLGANKRYRMYHEKSSIHHSRKMS